MDRPAPIMPDAVYGDGDARLALGVTDAALTRTPREGGEAMSEYAVGPVVQCDRDAEHRAEVMLFLMEERDDAEVFADGQPSAFGSSVLPGVPM